MYQRLPYRVKINDQRLHGINLFVTRGLGPTVSVLDSVLKLEKILMSDVKSEIDDGKIVLSKTEQDQGVGVLNTVTFDIRKMHLLMSEKCVF